MRKWLYAFLCMMTPAFAFAADSGSGSLSFAPPAGDYSVIFLSNLFGGVDGVLHGTGSQVMGNMFGVFNSAVLALGGIIIMYTLMVSTMNTAHEGQFLGQKWSSIWIPVRSTLGLALIIPKASGYCLMQIFVMWVVVQGVGAADKVWESALSYLNRGGVIIKAQQGSPINGNGLANIGGKVNPTPNAAYTMLTGQVCMGFLQKQLEAMRKSDLSAESKRLGSRCKNDLANGDMKDFCTNPVPDFIGSVDFIAAQNRPPPYTVSMPDFDVKSPYSKLNGICGKIQWTRFGGLDNTACSADMAQTNSPNSPGKIKPAPQSGCGMLSSAESDTLAKARPIALTAMYNDLSSLAQIIIDNIPEPATDNTMKKTPFSDVAMEQFGVPYTDKGEICQKYGNCLSWGGSAGSTQPPLFNSGAEFLYAILDYNRVMLPNLNLVQQLKDVKNAGQAREFIAKANREGWIMAGSYFFDLVRLNGDASSNTGLIDLDSGLEASVIFNSASLTSAFNNTGGCKTSNTDFPVICTWLEKLSRVQPLLELINDNGSVQAPNFAPNETTLALAGKASSTVSGYVQNSVLIQLPGQPGLGKMDIAKFPQFKLNTKVEPLPPVEFDCGWVFLLGCLGRALGEFFWNGLVLGIYSAFLKMLAPIITSVVNTFVMLPLQAMSGIFVTGIEEVSKPGVNPVIALANMGAHYINAAGDMWLNMLMLSISTSIIPVIGKFIFALITLSMPIVIAWLGLMMGVGFITCYYIPILPFLIFTFASIGWLIAVIEAMVAAPIVALGITHPEGHDAFGKGEQAVMILMNVFLRPAMMVIGYVSAIALCYVGIWLLNAGFQHAIGFVIGIPDTSTPIYSYDVDGKPMAQQYAMQKGYEGYGATWAGVYAFFFAILAYTSAYLTIVQKSFTLIHYLPDKVLRWIGGQPEGIGGETAGWADETKGQIKEGGDKTGAAQGKIGEKLGASAEKGMEKLKDNAKQVAMAGSGGITPEQATESGDK